MKKLSEVIAKDAKEIICAGYPHFFKVDNWKFDDASEELNEPCKKLYSRLKAFSFWFFNDKIDIDLENGKDALITFDDVNYDVKMACYVKAFQLGYHVEALEIFRSKTELVNTKEEVI